MPAFSGIKSLRNVSRSRVTAAMQNAAAQIRRSSASTDPDPGEKSDPAASNTIPEPAAAETPVKAPALAEEVFRYFREIAAIPHGSFHTEALSDYLEQFALSQGLEYRRDAIGNLIICRPASPGCEKAAPFALQGHIDMVCEKESSNPINMETEAITLITDGDWLRADGTTLGGDDGIAVAIMLALLSDDSLICPPLECIFTVDEEVGLLGAAALDLSSLQSRRLLNLDSESEGVITAGCAGGAEMICTLAGRRRNKKGHVLELRISGLRGGHSGESIGEGRANADLLLARLLYRLEKAGKYSIVSIDGGTRDNAIPREAAAEIIFTGKISAGVIEDEIHTCAREFAREFSTADPEIRVDFTWIRGAEDPETDPAEEEKARRKECRSAFTRKDTRRLVRFLMALPNGVIEYSDLDRDIPRTSLSLGILKTLEDGFRTHSLVRSGIDSRKQMLIDRITCIADQFGASVRKEGDYPAWELIRQSAFRDLAVDVYRKATGREAKVSITHGGLECALLAAAVPGLDCISIGPDMVDIHTPSERLSISSSERIYAFVRELLSECAREQ